MPILGLFGALLPALRARLSLQGGEITVTASHTPYILLHTVFLKTTSDTL